MRARMAGLGVILLAGVAESSWAGERVGAVNIVRPRADAVPSPSPWGPGLLDSWNDTQSYSSTATHVATCLAYPYVAPQSCTLERVEFYAGGLAGTVTVAILGDDGSGTPTGPVLGSATYAESAILNWQGATLIPPVQLVKGSRYYIRYQPVPGSWCGMARGGSPIRDIWSDDSCATWRGPESAFNWKARFYGVLHVDQAEPAEVAQPADHTMRGRFGLEARLSNVTFVRDTPLAANGVSIETHPKATRSLGGSVTYFVSESVSLEGYVGYISTSVELSAKDIDGTVLATAESDVSSVPLVFSVHLRAPARVKKMAAYAFGGVGNYFNDAEAANISDSFETHIGVGAEYYLSANSAVNIELRKSWTTPEEPVPGVSGLEVEYDINPFSIGIGYKHYFKAASTR